MATGQGQSGGVFAWPDVPELGYETWAEMTGMHPHHPLVGGHSGSPGYEAGPRKVAIGAPQPTMGAASGAPMSSHWSEVFNFKGNPIGWVLIAAILYLGLAHVSLRGGASAGLGIGK